MDAGERVIAFWVYWAMIGDSVKAVGARVGGYLVAGGVAAALLFYAFGKVDAWLGRDDAETTAHSAAVLKIHDANVRFRAKMAADELLIQASAAAAHDTANALRAIIGALPLEQQPRTILVRIARADSTAYAKCSVSLVSCQLRASLAEADNRQLADQLRQQMKVKDHRCGIFVGWGLAAYNAPNATARSAWEIGAGCRVLRIPFLF